MTKFRKNNADILVATDVAARGIDVPRVGLVVNYDVPNQDMIYFHRIGRTARAGAKGNAVTLVSYSSIADWNIIKRQIKSDLIDLNQKMGIEIHIPDPLKREGRRRIAPQQHSRYGRSSAGRTGGYGSGGYRTNAYKRDVSARDQYKRKKPGRFSTVTRSPNRKKW
jgi:ATP-dependent RNA helicase DeaD